MAKKFIIKGGKTLKGTVSISGYKNSAGAILAASLLSEKTSIIDNLPICSDVSNMLKLLEQMGAKIKHLGPNKIEINPAPEEKKESTELEKLESELGEIESRLGRIS